jgi:hypothetical protein
MIRNKIKGINLMNVIKIKFQDCASKGISLPDTSATQHYATLLAKAEADDKMNENLDSGVFSSLSKEQIKQANIVSVTPEDLALSNGSVVSFSSNVERLNAISRAKGTRQSWWHTKMKLCNPALFEEGELFLKKVQAYADKDANFKYEWVEKETLDNGDIVQRRFSGQAQFGFIGKRPTSKVGNHKLLGQTITKSEKVVEKSS